MPDFIRRYLSSASMLRSPGEGGAEVSDAGATDAGGDSSSTESTPQAGAAEGADAGAITTADGSTPPADQTAGQQQIDRQQQRMNQLVAERWQERRAREEADQQIRLLQEQLNQARQAVQTQPHVDENGQIVQPQVPPQRAQVPLTADEINRQATAIAEQNAFNAQVAAEVARGRDHANGGYTDFDQVASNLQRFGELPRTFVEAALATGKGADVIYALGKDALEADRILSLPPMAQAVALAQVAANVKKPEAAKVVSSAPNPVVPKGGSSKTINTPSLEDENMSTADWIALREKQLAAQKTNARGARR
jgi:hypothetical protein